MLLTIIIVNYKSENLLKNCLFSIKKFLPNSKIRVLIINNDKQDKLKNLSDFNFVEIINKKENVGFAKAVNLGLKRSSTEFNLLLNPDTLFIDNSVLEMIQFARKNKKIGVVGCKLFNPRKNSTQNSITRKPNFLTAIFEFTNIKKIFPNNKFSKNFYFEDTKIKEPRRIYGTSGACMLIKKKLTEKIGFFDENFFMYLEDLDFCIRANKSNFYVYYYPYTKVLHYEGSSSKPPYNINIKAWNYSRRYFFKKHLNTILGSIFLPIIFFIDRLIIDTKHKFEKIFKTFS
jgi:hypothetical protein